MGTINLIVPCAVYERHRQLARAEPLLLARGRLERHDDSAPAAPVAMTKAKGPVRAPVREPAPPILNVIVSELHALERFLPGAATSAGEQADEAQVHRLGGARAPAGGEEDRGDAEVGAEMRAVSPPVQSFAAGRRR